MNFLLRLQQRRTGKLIDYKSFKAVKQLNITATYFLQFIWLLEYIKMCIDFLFQLTASDLYQKQNDRFEFFGFNFSDILDLRFELMSVSCQFCGRSSPPVCCTKCGARYHLPCGLKNFCVTVMNEPFHSYCNCCYVLKYPGLLKTSKTGSCFLCLEDYERFDLIYRPKCCNVDASIHLHCLKVS